MKIYVAGPITGRFDYKEKFYRAERELKRRGHIVINPSVLPQGLEDYMKICYALLDQADAIYLLRGWEHSIGAKMEYAHAKYTKKQIIKEEYEKELEKDVKEELEAAVNKLGQQ